MKTGVWNAPFGLDIVNNAEWLKDAGDIVGSHHEKYIGSGYGEGLERGRIPDTTRIFAIADVFDALTSRRPYKEPFYFEKTMEILKPGRGSHFTDARFRTQRFTPPVSH